jgi:hypothetical protein
MHAMPSASRKAPTVGRADGRLSWGGAIGGAVAWAFSKFDAVAHHGVVAPLDAIPIVAGGVLVAVPRIDAVRASFPFMRREAVERSINAQLRQAVEAAGEAATLATSAGETAEEAAKLYQCRLRERETLLDAAVPSEVFSLPLPGPAKQMRHARLILRDPAAQIVEPDRRRGGDVPGAGLPGQFPQSRGALRAGATRAVRQSISAPESGFVQHGTNRRLCSRRARHSTTASTRRSARITPRRQARSRR